MRKCSNSQKKVKNKEYNQLSKQKEKCYLAHGLGHTYGVHCKKISKTTKARSKYGGNLRRESASENSKTKTTCETRSLPPPGEPHPFPLHSH